MTSRPALGTHGSGAPSRNQVRRPSKPANALPPDCIDPTLEDERPAAHNGASEARPPPRGRPHIFYSTLASSAFDLPIHSFPYQPTVNLPVPPRPGSLHLRDASQQRQILPGGTGVKDAPKLGVPETVPIPVHFPGEKAADVFPWTGTNAEDTLSEALVKAGVSNKPQIMNETNTARPSLWSNLKNKSGITTLSTLFVAVLEKRQQNGRLQTPNTFKPPPRLTLRDSTREGWLHDLANPTVSLRRLSRTIPHGLTGKVLLDQCLNKNIPLPRALWLAKCVGINELRAHKRKGQAGTVTWGRGWTSSVEQFLDSVISTIGQGDWKPRITYALQLATHFYKEHLLDDDHFLGWILDGLDMCSSERLFIWLLVVAVPHYWNDISSCRQRGKRLAESLLNHLAKLSPIEDLAAPSTALQFLENSLLKLVTTRPACLLLPISWPKHSAALKALVTKRNLPQTAQAVEKLDGRNTRLLSFVRNGKSSSRTGAARVFHKLDSINYAAPIRIEDLSYECMEITSNAVQLISTLLHWACSCYRAGSHRIYLATRLLRRWSHLGADVYEGIIVYLQSMSWVKSGEIHVLLRIVAELVRSKHFSVGRYLQWLIATGSLGCDASLSLPSSWPVRLITEVPLTGLSDQVRTLRSTLLRGTAHSTELEEQALANVKRSISQAVPAIFGLSLTIPSRIELNFAKLSGTIRLEIGIWLRQQVAQHAEVNEHVPTKDISVEETAAVSLISCYDYHVVRSYLEQCEDLAILADVIGITASSLDMAVLASVADTLLYHMKTFRAIGAFDPLLGRLAMRYAAIRTVRFPERELLLSFQNLARTAQPDGQLLQLLAYDLSRLDQKNAVAACSPASDNMGEVMQHAGTCSDDEIERILSSGTSMDQNMMSRVLRKLVRNLEEHVDKGYRQFENHPAWFWRLRNFDEATFDVVLREWLETSIMACQLHILQIAIPPLVASSCMELSSFLDILRSCLANAKATQVLEPVTIAIDVLRLLLPSGLSAMSCSSQDAYRYRTEQYKLCFTSDTRIIHCIGEVADLVLSTQSNSMLQTVSSLLSSETVLSIVKEHVVSDPDCLSKMKTGQSGQASFNTCFKTLLNGLLDPSGQWCLADISPEEQIIAVFKAASELSLPLCQAMIEHIFASSSALDTHAADGLSVAVLNAVRTSMEQDQSQGLELLTNLEGPLADKIRSHAEREVLDASYFLLHGSTDGIASDCIVKATMMQKYLTVIELTMGETPQADEQFAMLAALTDRFKGIFHALSDCGGLGTPTNQATASPVVQVLAALLSLVASHGPQLLRNATQSHQAALMVALQDIVTHASLELFPSIIEHVFDVLIVLSDHISEDVRNQIARLESAKSTNSDRAYFIHSQKAPIDGWLMLTKPVIPPLDPPQPPNPNTTQNQSSPYQSPQMTSNTAAPQHRYFNQQQQQSQTLQPSQQTQHMRTYPQYAQHAAQPNRHLPAQLQRTPSHHASLSPLQQMQHMQQLQGLAQQRASQPSPIHSQRPTSVASPGGMGGLAGGNAAPSKAHTSYVNQQRDTRQYPFVQPRWEILAESSGNPTLNETAISLSLFGARRV
ncbi:mediator of RNA polymerase II transcription subunit 12 [Parastagonospora nodorum]|nr:mediator of RNA polymerase II transcription subunit 12 [Parastagonospora nodorum]KAH3987844.1 mediator of RNA polymerase II transcription subunit 12 [Parastagonospora nodorum]KAH4000922.1 mediator of RNA polymerase II transcription subunit 12 [Parastagonospora nodorum]KAH4033411.1 mediator of RNA polymerase II transcription subunit 12 [Parastagonospora nodorum]KAH4060615.1 mediator of RNA polymerase II transcription subunit 12 [Parastagonospora nodorum]